LPANVGAAPSNEFDADCGCDCPSWSHCPNRKLPLIINPTNTVLCHCFMQDLDAQQCRAGDEVCPATARASRAAALARLAPAQKEPRVSCPFPRAAA
jgi:hypothetical protein